MMLSKINQESVLLSDNTYNFFPPTLFMYLYIICIYLPLFSLEQCLAAINTSFAM